MRKALVFLAVATALGGCGRELPPIPEPDSRPAKLFTVSVGDAKFERTFPAVSEAGDKAVLTFRVPGQLQTIDVTAGQRVTKGLVLATLNPDEYALLAKQARANFKLADVQYERYKKLRADKVVSEQDFDQAQANHNSARATLEQAEANLRYTKLIAPYDGTISLIPAENHEYVAAKQGVMNIQTNQLMKVIFQLPDHLLGRFSQGVEPNAVMRFDAFPGSEFPLRFQEIDTEADTKTGSYKVTMIMERPADLGVLPGMAGSVHVSAKSQSATQIPTSAIFKQDEKKYVWRVNEQSIVELAEVELNDKREVVNGLNDGDQIIISGVSGIESGIKVREWVKERGL
ncbi:efflux RND transporter periplasmic adaptor subunit [Vibrio vulnificus]|uniref:efflux RND transporter periplasmic adaptor subunit n=1 Tax=Vibrio vulnificus TaxID=672 RepID=UPI001A2D70F3|nr:efflux RND transporter periplasmic adaptor subunit [Vibrio vulnificus]ELY5144173.1 efflux RND transporter periplasmic adaptor subunit [Vibrio vulnificus]MCA0777962.1 efflux RND transporter periplasmic adaptor subunit [Vibrio vulnificus]NTJ36980.1 efflux RND transporter periplasmic adaptor subunit [Vibrio vulnificus]HAS6187027.1 efflux RND transporter periplasmic adaptor subunit [Vibrio vulnificus]HAS6219364.1 efflux RND transporter periplasmic adaptor subunit [Vibrio vulnificus]